MQRERSFQRASNATAATLVVGFVALDAAVQRVGRIDRLGQDRHHHHFLACGSGRQRVGTSWHFVDGSERQVHHALNRVVGVDVVHLDGQGGRRAIVGCDRR